MLLECSDGVADGRGKEEAEWKSEGREKREKYEKGRRKQTGKGDDVLGFMTKKYHAYGIVVI